VRGHENRQSELFSYFVCPEERVPAKHPLRLIKADVERVLHSMSPEFDKLYKKRGRPSIPPEQLLKAPRVRMGCVQFISPKEFMTGPRMS